MEETFMTNVINKYTKNNFLKTKDSVTEFLGWVEKNYKRKEVKIIVDEILKNELINLERFGTIIFQFCSWKRLNDELVFILKRKEFDPSRDNNLAIRVASRYGRSKIVYMLLKDSRVDPTVNNCFALYSATYFRHLRVVQLLLKDGRSDPTIGSNAPLRIAIKGNQPKIVNLFLSDRRVKSTVSYGELEEWIKEAEIPFDIKLKRCIVK